MHGRDGPDGQDGQDGLQAKHPSCDSWYLRKIFAATEWFGRVVGLPLKTSDQARTPLTTQIVSLPTYRRWLRDQAAYKRKAMHGVPDEQL